MPNERSQGTRERASSETLSYLRKLASLVDEALRDFSLPEELTRSYPGGRPAYPPALLLRSWVLMSACGRSVSAWVRLLQRDEALRALVSGAGRAPSVGSHYNFVRRFAQVGAPGARWMVRPLTKGERRQAGESDRARAVKREGISEQRRLEVSAPGWRAPAELRGLHELLAHVVAGSIKRGLLCAPEALELSLDGSVYRSLASRRGRRTCGCDDRKCKHMRAYSDPDAGLLFKQSSYQFGYQLIGISAMATGRDGARHDLPLFLQLRAPIDGELPASIEALETFARLDWRARLGGRRRLPGYALTADLGYDALPFYRQLNDLSLKSVIPLLREGKRRIEEDKKRTPRPADGGPPRCPSGQQMIRHGKLRGRGTCYRCPARVAFRAGGKLDYRFEPTRCALPEPCDTTRKIGPTLYVEAGSALRFQPEIERGSAEFQRIYKDRNSIERCFSYLKIGAGRTRRIAVARLLITCRAIVKHLSCWARDDALKLLDSS